MENLELQPGYQVLESHEETRPNGETVIVIDRVRLTEVSFVPAEPKGKRQIMHIFQTADGVAYEVGYGSNCPPGTKGGQHVSRDYVWFRQSGDTSGIYEGWQCWSGSLHHLIEAIQIFTADEFQEWVNHE